MLVEYLQVMLDEMTSFGSHEFQNSAASSTGLRDRLQSLFLGVEPDAAPSQLIGMLEASVENALTFTPK